MKGGENGGLIEILHNTFFQATGLSQMAYNGPLPVTHRAACTTTRRLPIAGKTAEAHPIRPRPGEPRKPRGKR